MRFILLLNIHLCKVYYHGPLYSSTHHSASNTTKLEMAESPKGDISQYTSNLLMLSKTHPAPRQGNYYNFPSFCRHNIPESLGWRGKTGCPRLNLRRRPILYMFSLWFLLLLLLLLPASSTGENKQRQQEEGQSKVCNTVHSTYSLSRY